MRPPTLYQRTLQAAFGHALEVLCAEEQRFASTTSNDVSYGRSWALALFHLSRSQGKDGDGETLRHMSSQISKLHTSESTGVDMLLSTCFVSFLLTVAAPVMDARSPQGRLSSPFVQEASFAAQSTMAMVNTWCSSISSLLTHREKSRPFDMRACPCHSTMVQ